MGGMNSDIPTDEFDAELARYLTREFDGSMGGPGAGGNVGGDILVHIRTLKSSPHETTELVWCGSPQGGEPERCVLKTIDADSGIGGAYELLYQAQNAGTPLDAAPRIISYECSNGKIRVLMEYLAGESLDMLAERVGAGPTLARRVFVPLCEAVESLHAGLGDPDEAARPLIHRDLKPANIIVQDGPAAREDAGIRVRLIDFGIARSWRADALADTVKFGTRSYAPPEQFGFGQTDVRSDVYALGAVLYFCLTGKDPEPGKKIQGQLDKGGVSKPFAEVIARAMALDPDARYATVRDLGAAFDASIAPVVFTVPCPTGSRSSRPQSPLRVAVGIAWNFCLALGLLLVFVGSAFAILDPTDSNERLSTWFLALEYIAFVDVSTAAIALWLLDKSRLRTYAPMLDRARGLRYLLRAGLLIFVLYLAVMGIGFVSGEVQRL